MSNRLYIWNAYESALNGAINTTAATIPLDSTAGLRNPGILVIDPDNNAKREYISYVGLSGGSLTGVIRNLAGGVLSAHDDGAIVRSVHTHQIIDNIFTDIETAEAHAAAANPHSGSAASSDLATTDANVAANTAGVASNLTSINTNAADLIAHDGNEAAHHPVSLEAAYLKTRINNQASFQLTATSGWQTVESVTAVSVPAGWNTYDLILSCGGVADVSVTATVVQARMRADIPTATSVPAVGGDPTVGGVSGVRSSFSIEGRVADLDVVTVPNVTARLECEAFLQASWVNDVWFKIQLQRKT